jgi:hypothetical protein
MTAGEVLAAADSLPQGDREKAPRDRRAPVADDGSHRR